ncbi:MAG TPA: DUF3302 domain-containing protein [Phycisphaerae bacterium]|nr:DUF3302 domain-containing protein [Phycisphaerae bacterium]
MGDAGFVLVMVVVAIAVIFTIGLLPGYVATSRRHSKREAIWVCTILSLFLWPLWFVAMIWAFTEAKPTPRRWHPRPAPPPAPEPTYYAPEPPLVVAQPVEQCANCGRSIGALETPHVWQGRIVCSGCRQILETTF